VLKLTDGHASGPLSVEVRDCAVRTEALLGLDAKTPAVSLSEKLQWTGRGNQFDILGRSWIVGLPGGEPVPNFRNVSDLSGWSSVAKQETESVAAAIEYSMDPQVRSSPIQPRDFAIQAPTSRQNRPGADPELVGPWNGE
jgi:hypothetical protein